MYNLIGQDFINMIKSFYPTAKVAAGGSEVVVRCFQCGDSKDAKHAHLYIKVPKSADEVSLCQCKKCGYSSVVDDIFLRKLGCDDSKVLIEVLSNINRLKKTPKYAMLNSVGKYNLRNDAISKQSWNRAKLDYINSRIGSNFTYRDILDLKIFLNLYDILQLNNLQGTRYQLVTDALNEHFVGFISYDNSYCIMRKCDDVELYKSVDKRYVNYNLINKNDSNKDFYVIPTSVNVEDPSPVRIHVTEGVFDILSVYYNLNGCNKYQNIYISASGKSYVQALSFLLYEFGIINYELHFYPDNDVSDYDFNKLAGFGITLLPANIYIHRNAYPNEKDYGVPMSRIKDTVRVIYEKNI